MFIFGDAIAMDMAEMAAKMPAILLTARLVKKGLESTMYAILAIYHDFGKNVAISIGTTLMMYFRIDFDSRPCHYEMLPWLIVISHTILPMLAFPFAFLLIPDVKMSDTTAFDKYTVSETYGDVSRFDDTDSDIDNVVSGRANGDVGSDNDEGEMDETRGEDVGNSEDVGINGEIRERGEISLSGLSGNGDGSRNDRDY
ncbi:hypothetical protein MHBO_004940 [Bonamia ostreae]|uniref:Uncharacterized protein n=1 Tax=Bonamia ostreae TaxID=126728 RepID=A0ABV2AUM6_9EUKA